jgi:LuxR family maltose regulon positive regulatory protein
VHRRGSDGERGSVRAPSFAPFRPKLTAPSAAPDLVARPRLVDRLLTFTGREVVVSAPAGYGKTTLVAQWAEREPRPFAWVSLDTADDDPAVLVTYLALALHEIESLPDADLALLTHDDVDLDALLDGLRRVLANRTRPFVLALDDVHRIDGAGRDVVDLLAHTVPPGATLALLTRGRSPVATSRAALLGDVLVIDRDDLAMTAPEADRLLRTSGVDADADTTATIRDLTEGWPAALYLAALALREADDAGVAVHEIRGRNRRIADFLSEEVLPALDADDVEFLLATSILDRCNGDLCDTVLVRSGSGAVLERLARTNRFVIPLDGTGDWYRYHHLFADMLRAEARRRDPAAFAAVAARASAWWEQQFEPDDAITLALAAGDRARVIDLIGRYAVILQNTRRVPTVERWLGAFTGEEIERTPTLAVTAAWNGLMDGDAGRVHRFATAVAQHHDGTPLADGTPPEAAVALLEALTTIEGLGTVCDHAARAFADHPLTSPYRAIAASIAANAEATRGEWTAAAQWAEQAIRIGRVGMTAALVHGLAASARVDAAAADWGAARVSVEEALALIDAEGFADRPAMTLAYSIAALVHAHCGDAARADAERHHTDGLLERLDGILPFALVCSILELAEAAVLTGQIDDATALLSEAQRRLRRLRDTGLLPTAVERIGTLIASRTMKPSYRLVEPLSPAELRVLGWLPTHLSFGEIGEELFLSRNTVKSHAMAIYRKLGVTSRSAAVREATRLGLLPG